MRVEKIFAKSQKNFITENYLIHLIKRIVNKRLVKEAAKKRYQAYFGHSWQYYH
jgi:hypothetical protein